eukprot:CAMPEP_0172161266 /NCGR_PEP_ID=MMETSP1050-20130122/6031_1 /TAXON_ID=233186 /ORGANISM="Cryptomonas curvata, Strain CCAP979/52" /LENGTH=196 /DNA_ID=CAMNT_0012831147 /DNA_START=26 /DNA_END=612 /DNA_ORIENTATION=-
MSGSTLDLVRGQVQDTLGSCPRGEARIREYLHRTKLACELVQERRKERNQALLGSSSPSGKECTRLPHLSVSAPPSPTFGRKHEQPLALGHIRELLSPATTMMRDRRSLSAMAKIHGEVDIESRIPPGVSWSPTMATKSKEWCDFVLDKPNRVWDWGKRMSEIEVGQPGAAPALLPRKPPPPPLREETAALRAIAG